LAQVVRDVAAVNAALAARAALDGRRVVATLTWRGHPRAFLAALRVGRALAALTGDVAVDLEVLPAPVPAEEPAGGGGAGGNAGADADARRRRCRRAARARAAAAAASASPSASPRALHAAACADAPEDAEDAEAEPFEAVLPVRRATLQQLYSFLRPALAQLAADAATSARAAAGTSTSTAGAGAMAQSTTSEEDAAAGVCAICYDAPCDTVTPCAHAFCADCYARWRATAPGCALCRAPLPPERRRGGSGGGGAVSWALLSEADVPSAEEAALGAGLGGGVTAARLAAWIDALPLAA
jgi:hypothetical protein